MSAMPAPTFATAPDLALFAPVLDAAARLGCHPGHLNRRCKAELAASGMAVKAADPSRPGPPRWYVRRTLDPRLSTDATMRISLADAELTGFTGKQQTLTRQRVACVKRFRQAKRDDRRPVKQWLGELLDRLGAEFPDLPLSRSHLYRWDATYHGPADTVKLIDARGGDRKSVSAAAAWAYFRDLYLHQNQPTVAQCWQTVRDRAAAEGWGWCSLGRCREQLDRRIPPQVQARHRDPGLYRRQLAPFIEQRAEAADAGQMWIGDDKQLDLVCRFQGQLIRPWMSVWMDWRTRRVGGWILTGSPNSTTILAALRHGLKDPANFGGPEMVWTDNGKAYDCWQLHGQTKKQRLARIPASEDDPRRRGIFAALQIEPHFATPFNPNGKARLERWFRTLERFCRTFDTYTGDGPDTKPERLKEILASPAAIPSFDQVYQRLAPHVAGYNARAEHAKDDLCDEAGRPISPDEAMARWCQSRRVHDDAALDLLLMAWHKPLTVSRNGVSLSLRGRTFHYGQFSPELAPFKALRRADRPAVLVSFDPHDLDWVRVYDADYRYVCTAPMNQLGGMHRAGKIGLEHVAELNRRKARYDRAQRDRAELGDGITQAFTPEEQLMCIAGERPKANVVAADPQPTMRLVSTPLDGQAAAVGRAERTAAAVADATPPRQSAMERLREKQGAELADRGLPPEALDEVPSDPWKRLRDKPRRLHG